jgi:hypothetical protein
MIPAQAMQSELVQTNNRVARRALERIGTQECLGVLETFCVLQRPNAHDDASLAFHIVGFESSDRPTVDAAFQALVTQDLELARGLLEQNRLVMVALFDGVNTRWIPVPDEAIGVHFRTLEGGVEPLEVAKRTSLVH